jgi:hypothetical protein
LDTAAFAAVFMRSGVHLRPFRSFPFGDLLGKTAGYETSPGVLRMFCPICSGSLAFRQVSAPEKECLMLGAFDDPSQIAVNDNVEQVFAERELPWLHVAGGFTRHIGQPMGMYNVK